MFDGFKQFVLRGNVVDLAVGVIVGAAFNNVVQALVKDLLTPFLSLLGGQPDFSFRFTIGHTHFLIGDFINTIIAFLINATIIYFIVVLPLNRLSSLRKNRRHSDDPATKKCPECLSEIPAHARRCAYCTTTFKDVGNSSL